MQKQNNKKGVKITDTIISPIFYMGNKKKF